MRDYGYEAQMAAEKHVRACDEALSTMDDGLNIAADWPEDMAGPYCGCEVCVIRETLHAAWPIAMEYARDFPQGGTQ